MEIFDDANLIIASGLFFYRGLHGRRALRTYAADFRAHAVDQSAVNGHFALLIEQDGIAHLLTDHLGVCKIYHNDDRTWLSDSYVLVLGGARTKTVVPQSVYEYAWCGTVFGGRTLFKQIESFDPNGTHRLTQRLQVLASNNDLASPGFVNAGIDEILGHFQDRMTQLFSIYNEHFGTEIECSMSGGLDSRLMLAALLKSGVAPTVLVYGSPETLDVRIAQEIASGERLQFRQIQKHPGEAVTLADFPALMRRIHWAFDGWGVEGSFTVDAELFERIRRGRAGLYMNGSLGEVFRNFFYLPNREFTACQVALAFFSRYSPNWTKEPFKPHDYTTSLSKMIQRSLGSESGSLSREAVELVYPLVRGRYWTARDLAINLRFGLTAYPFMEAGIIAGTCNIPLSFKSAGRLEHALIRRINPEIVKYRTCYSDDPRRPQSFSHLIDYIASVHRPILLRKHTYRVKQTLRLSRSLPKTLTPAYLSSVIDPALPHMSRYFHIDRVKDHAVLSRIATMEYLCEHYSATHES